MFSGYGEEGYSLSGANSLHTDSHFCTPGQGHEKGGVEHGVGFGRRNFMVPLPEVASFEELNALLLEKCLADDQRQVDGQEVIIGQAWEREKPHLRPRPERDFECCVVRPVVLNPYSQVEFETNRYSGPPSGFPTFQQPLRRRLALFSIIKWPCFQLSKCKAENQTGPVFDYQMALFSFDRNIGRGLHGHAARQGCTPGGQRAVPPTCHIPFSVFLTIRFR